MPARDLRTRSWAGGFKENLKEERGGKEVGLALKAKDIVSPEPIGGIPRWGRSNWISEQEGQ